jgi:hypothetical protein
MTTNMYFYYQISIKMAFAFEFQSSPIIYSSREVYLLLNFTIFETFSRTSCARSAYHLACSTTSITFHSHYHYALMESHKASTLATSTFLRFCTWLGLRAVAGMTSTSTFKLKILVYKNYTFEAPFTA